MEKIIIVDETGEKKSILEKLPKDVLISHVFARLLIDSNDFESVSRLSRTNKYLSEISRDEEMWRAALNKKGQERVSRDDARGGEKRGQKTIYGNCT